MNDLKRAQELGSQLLEAQKRVEKIEADLAEARKVVLNLEREELPTLMKEIGVSEFKLTSGKKISIKEDCDASISKANLPKALTWLIKHGFGGIIKTYVAVSFGKGERAEAAKIAKAIKKEHPDNEVEMAESVHPSTLKSFVKEQLAKGTAIPMDLFGIHPYSKAVVTE